MADRCIALRGIPLVPALCATLGAGAQDMLLSSGTLTVAEGTTLTIVSPVQWTIASGAQVINNGTIDLGTEASLLEAPGAPITGSGTEHARVQLAQAFAGVEPGGLGLSLSAAAGPGLVEVVRGHEPFVLPSGASSVARWFLVDAAPQPGLNMEFLFRYDPTELNGLEPDGIALHTSTDVNGPWSPIVSSANAQAYSIWGSQQSPWAFLTAFDPASTTGMAPNTAQGSAAWPTVVDDVVTVIRHDGQAITQLDVFDTAGRLLRSERPRMNPALLWLGDLSPGTLVLRVDGAFGLKLLKR
jgi:hypothetical protein